MSHPQAIVQAIVVPAYAKLNLTLSVLGRRPDGYHDLASILQTISLHDTLHITPTHDGAITCDVDTTALQTEDNLVLRAARLLRQVIGDDRLGARITLRKQIPIQGGLGGGSSDGVTALLALNRLWGARLPDDQLVELAAEFGSDTAYFVHGGAARIAGRGEIVTPLPDAEPLAFVLANPPVSVSTAIVFRRLAPRDFGAPEDTNHVERAIAAGASVPFERLTNTLEPVVMAAYAPVIATREALLDLGAPLVRMSGSGPTLYVPFHEQTAAQSLFDVAREHGLRVFLCRSVGREEYRQAQLRTLA